MQEGIVALCLILAFAYIIYTYIRKIRHKGGGCCGCGKDCCTARATPCGEQDSAGKILSAPPLSPQKTSPKIPQDGI